MCIRDSLYEFDGGRWSGWMYCVNDWYPNYGCGQYAVKNGDVIEWNYTYATSGFLDKTRLEEWILSLIHILQCSPRIPFLNFEDPTASVKTTAFSISSPTIQTGFWGCCRCV